MKVPARSSALVGVLSTAALTLTLMACGSQPAGTGGPTTGPNSAQPFNEVDVAFAQQMIVHHQQAIAMTKMAQSRAQDPNVKRLAAEIEAAQGPEIQTMTGWLQAWATPMPSVPPGMTPSSHGMAPSSGGMMHSMPGMVPQPDMSTMMDRHGAEFDRMFLQEMITHHQGAVDMAKIEQSSGANPEAMRLAKSIESSQTAQITQMRQLLSSPAPTRS
jgi:uncharacterized protein (DUF305 family)